MAAAAAPAVGGARSGRGAHCLRAGFAAQAVAPDARDAVGARRASDAALRRLSGSRPGHGARRELLLLALPGAALALAGAGFIVHQLALFARLMLRGLWLSDLAERE